MENQDKETDESQDNITGKEAESPPESSLSPQTESSAKEEDASEELSAPPSPPMAGDMESLPLSEEIRKQKESMMRTKKLTLVGVVGVIALLVLIKVFTGKKKASGPTQTATFTTAPEFPEPTKSEPVRPTKPIPPIQTANAAKKTRTHDSTGERKDYFLYGVNKHSQGNNIEAIKAFRKGMEKNPGLKEIGYNNQGVIFAEKGDSKKGIQYFKQALKVNPRYVDAHYNLASAYEKNGDGQRAFFHFQRFLELAKDDYSELAGRVKRHLGTR